MPEVLEPTVESSVSGLRLGREVVKPTVISSASDAVVGVGGNERGATTAMSTATGVSHGIRPRPTVEDNIGRGGAIAAGLDPTERWGAMVGSPAVVVAEAPAAEGLGAAEEVGTALEVVEGEGAVVAKGPASAVRWEAEAVVNSPAVAVVKAVVPAATEEGVGAAAVAAVAADRVGTAVGERVAAVDGVVAASRRDGALEVEGIGAATVEVLAGGRVLAEEVLMAAVDLRAASRQDERGPRKEDLEQEDDRFMRMALRLAERAGKAGEVPVCACVGSVCFVCVRLCVFLECTCV